VIDPTKPDREALIIQAARAIAEVYRWNEVGGNLHIVIDDMNVEDHWLASCRQSIEKNESGGQQGQVKAELACLAVMQPLTESERIKAIELSDRAR